MVNPVKALGRPLTCNEFMIGGINVTLEQGGGISICSGNDEGWHTHHISSQACSNQVLDGMLRRDEHLATHVSAFLLGSQLIFKMHTCRSGFNHRFHQLENI